MGNFYSSKNPYEDEINNDIKENPILVFTTSGCGYCVKAKKHLFNESIDYVEKNLTQLQMDEPQKFPEYSKTLMEMTKIRTVPQIFVCGKFIGGCDDLESLIRRDALLDLLELCNKEKVASIRQKRKQLFKL
uniref:Glutaredoxin domain-containing protein n=1 Tax=Strongyloides venezuelensis TaxID=75913 RepID=A0A0K0F5Y3_STRVS